MYEHVYELGEAETWDLAALTTAIDKYETMLRAADKKRATVTTYVEHAERFVNWLAGSYRPRSAKTPKPYGDVVLESTGKYAPLFTYLDDHADNAVRLTFRTIERIIGAKLPRSAYKYAHWWANDRTGNHVQATAWLSANYRVADLSIIDCRVMFIRSSRDYRNGKTRVM